MKSSFLLITLLFFFCFSFSQQKKASYPAIGEPCPDFYLSDVQHYIKSQVSPEDFKNKWFILDFWNRYCGVCLGKFQLTDSLQKKFRKQIQFILVGYTGSQYTHHSDDKPIRELYERLRNQLHINLPVAYDSLLFHRFNITACPCLIIVDPKGIVRAVTSELNEQDIENIFCNDAAEFSKRHL